VLRVYSCDLYSDSVVMISRYEWCRSINPIMNPNPASSHYHVTEFCIAFPFFGKCLESSLVNKTQEPSRIIGYLSRHTREMFGFLWKGSKYGNENFFIHKRDTLFQVKAIRRFAMFALSKDVCACPVVQGEGRPITQVLSCITISSFTWWKSMQLTVPKSSLET
jgi:hypothetical protein